MKFEQQTKNPTRLLANIGFSEDEANLLFAAAANVASEVSTNALDIFIGQWGTRLKHIPRDRLMLFVIVAMNLSARAGLIRLREQIGEGHTGTPIELDALKLQEFLGSLEEEINVEARRQADLAGARHAKMHDMLDELNAEIDKRTQTTQLPTIVPDKKLN